MIVGFVFGQPDKQPTGYLFSCRINSQRET